MQSSPPPFHSPPLPIESVPVMSFATAEEEADKGEECIEMLDPRENISQLDEPKDDKKDPPKRSLFKSFGHVFKTIVLGLGFSLFDVYSDVGSGYIHYQAKNVTRIFSVNDTIPEYCISLTDTTTAAKEGQLTHICEERDTVWAWI